jgi:hypothetical protein
VICQLVVRWLRAAFWSLAGLFCCCSAVRSWRSFGWGAVLAGVLPVVFAGWPLACCRISRVASPAVARLFPSLAWLWIHQVCLGFSSIPLVSGDAVQLGGACGGAPPCCGGDGVCPSGCMLGPPFVLAGALL